ncbi:MAG: DMT family transporter [Candidatus Zixiibacteriota bacterium]
MLPHLAHVGELLSFLCAIVWAMAVILFKKSGEKVPPLSLNLFKNVLSLALFALTSLALGITLLPKATLRDHFLVLTSGFLGIALSDTFFFKTLNLLGAELTSIVACLNSPFIIGLSVLFLGERMSEFQLLGVFLIVLAVVTVSQKEGRKNISRRDLLRGIFFGLLYLVSGTIGVVMFKPLLGHSSFLWVIEMRLLAGCLGTGAFLLLLRERRTILEPMLSAGNLRYMLPGSFLGAYLATVIWVGGLKYTQASTASALNQTSSIFVFILAAILLREPVNLVRIIAIILAFAGVVIVSFG